MHFISVDEQREIDLARELQRMRQDVDLERQREFEAMNRRAMLEAEKQSTRRK